MDIFIIYARKDQEALNELRAHLKSTALTDKLNVWYDGEILPGQDWNEEIQTRLASANICLLLITKDFFNSNYIEKEELTQAIKRHENNLCIIIPIVVKDCVWEDYFAISKFQVLPNNAAPVYSNKWHNSDEAWAEVVRGIKKVVGLLREQKTIEPLTFEMESFETNKFHQSPYKKQTFNCVFCKGAGRISGGKSIFSHWKVCPACKGKGKLYI